MAIDLCIEDGGMVLVVIDKNLQQLTFVSDQIDRLGNRLINIVHVNGTPFTQDIYESVELQCIRPSHIIAIGGGSTIDYAKAMVAMFHFGSIESLGLHGNLVSPINNQKPVLVAIPTTAGSGAEASRYFVTYDRSDKHKIFGKNWSLIADWIMLDPVFMKSMPMGGLVACGFDAFVHFFESLICKNEKSSIGEMHSIYGITNLMNSLDNIIYKNQKSNENFTLLMEMSTLGGVSLTNVRTGNIHEAAGALLEITDLSHPETVFVFFRDAVEQYLSSIVDCERLIISHIRLTPAFEKFIGIHDVICWWEDLFLHVGLTDHIKLSMNELIPALDKAKKHVIDRVFADKVWITKESPVPLDEIGIHEFVNRSFSRFS